MPAWQWLIDLSKRAGSVRQLDAALAHRAGHRPGGRAGAAVGQGHAGRPHREAGREDRVRPGPRSCAGCWSRTRMWFLLPVALYCGSRALKLPEDGTALVRSAAIVALLLQAALWGNALLNFAVIHFTRQRMTTDAASATTISVLGFLGKLALWTIVVLMALDNLGVNVTAAGGRHGHRRHCRGPGGAEHPGRSVRLAGDHARPPLCAGRFDRRGRLSGNGGEHRREDHAAEEPLRRGADLFQQRPAQRPHPQLTSG